MKSIHVEVHLYGPLASYGGDQATKSHARLEVYLTAGAKMRDLLNSIGIPPSKKGLTFVNAVLSDMPGLSADLDVELHDGDRVGIFSKGYIWPFQYRMGARRTPELEKSMQKLGSGALRHSPRKLE